MVLRGLQLTCRRSYFSLFTIDFFGFHHSPSPSLSISIVGHTNSPFASLGSEGLTESYRCDCFHEVICACDLPFHTVMWDQLFDVNQLNMRMDSLVKKPAGSSGQSSFYLK